MSAAVETPQAAAVEYKLCKAMPYSTRVTVSLVLFAVGVSIQLLCAWWWGLPFVFFAILMHLCDGVTNMPDAVHFGKWENVTLEEFTRVRNTFEKLTEWGGKDRYSLTSCLGCLLFLFLLGGVAVIGGVALVTVEDQNSFFAILSDGGLALFLLFVTGRRHAWEPDGLKLKLDPLINACTYLAKRKDIRFKVTPMLEMSGKGKKQLPRDCKMMVKLSDAPDDFMGIQVQTSLNSVQGTNYPYMYCVLLAKPGSGLIDRVSPFLKDGNEQFGFFSDANDKKNPDRHKQRFHDAVIETESEKDVELVVVRQKTFGKGYHTDDDGQLRVVQTALELARRVYGLHGA